MLQVNFVERPDAPKIDPSRWRRNPPVPQITHMPGKIATSGCGLRGLPPDDGEVACLVCLWRVFLSNEALSNA